MDLESEPLSLSFQVGGKNAYKSQEPTWVRLKACTRVWQALGEATPVGDAGAPVLSGKAKLYSEALGKGQAPAAAVEGSRGGQQEARARVLGTKSAGVGRKWEREEDAITVPYRVLLLLIARVCVLQKQADGMSQLGETAATEVRVGGFRLRD